MREKAVSVTAIDDIFSGLMFESTPTKARMQVTVIENEGFDMTQVYEQVQVNDVMKNGKKQR